MALLMVGGIHGVGKTSLCAAVAPHLGAQHVSSGSLLYGETARAEPGKAVVDVETNQEAVVAKVLSLRSEQRHLLLDCHFTVINLNGQIVDIAVEYFERLEPDGLALVEVPVVVVVKRLQQRDRSDVSPQLVEKHLLRERERAIAVAARLGVPLCVISGDEAMARASGCLEKLLP